MPGAAVDGQIDRRLDQYLIYLQIGGYLMCAEDRNLGLAHITGRE